jgi:hypothetical protein
MVPSVQHASCVEVGLASWGALECGRGLRETTLASEQFMERLSGDHKMQESAGRHSCDLRAMNA